MTVDITNVLRPVAEPRVLDGVYTAEQHQRMLDVVRREGPWKLILAQHFKSAQEVVATLSGAMPEGVEPTFDMFLTANFRGYFADEYTSLYSDLEDVFYNSKFMAYAREYWQAKYVRPEFMLFNIQGPANSFDPGHLDAVTFRGITMRNSPTWLMNTMGKSGLFKQWLNKKAQVITWFYKGEVGGGFTYWPDGPLGQPKRIAAPMWNRGVVVQNEMKYHRAEPNGPVDQRHPQGLAFESLFGADPQVSDGWQITTGDKVVQKISAQEMRFLVHWNAEVFSDLNDLKKTIEHKDDLTHDKVFDIFIEDLRKRGEVFEMPSDPLHDMKFITLLSRTYDVGTPRIYPSEAPGPHQLAAAG